VAPCSFRMDTVTTEMIARQEIMRSARSLDPQKMPRHIAVIMDGNRRWAKQQGWGAIRGHTRGAQTTHDIIQACVDLTIPALTLYTFSTENWKRSRHEIAALMRLISRNLADELPSMMSNNVRVQHIGRREGLPGYLLRQIDECVQKTCNNTGMVLSLALNYGGRAEIIDAFRELVGKVQRGELTADAITEEHVEAALYTRGLPEPDLMVRTGGDMRISNFLPWQIAYAELWVTQTLWPDFKPNELLSAIADFQTRERRFGGVKQ
jgi:undecaprenyl diphosphate synthase